MVAIDERTSTTIQLGPRAVVSHPFEKFRLAFNCIGDSDEVIILYYTIDFCGRGAIARES